MKSDWRASELGAAGCNAAKQFKFLAFARIRSTNRGERSREMGHSSCRAGTVCRLSYLHIWHRRLGG